MSDAFWIALFVGIPATIAAAAQAVVSIIQAWRINTKVNTLGVKMEEVHKATNGAAEKRVEEARAAGFANGVKSEMDKRPNGPA